MTLKIDDFKAALKGGGVKPNLFRVIPSFPYGGDVQLSSFLIKTAKLPEQVLGEIPVPFRGRVLKIAGDRTFENWDITVIIDGEFTVRDQFEVWSNAINSHEGNIGASSVEEYMADWRVEQLDRGGNVIKSYTFRNCWPLNVGPVDLSSDSVDTIAEFTVSLSVESWASNTTS